MFFGVVAAQVWRLSCRPGVHEQTQLSEEQK